MSTRQRYRTLARQRYKRALWIAGTGPYALLAYCGGLTVLLYDTEAQAQQAKALIDTQGCGHACRGERTGEGHVIEDLSSLVT